MPVYGNRGQGNQTDSVMGVQNILQVTNDGAIAWDAFPVTFDLTRNPFLTQLDPAEASGYGGQTLRDLVQGNEWRLRRIVGKAEIFFGSYVQEEAADNVMSPLAEVAFGFIVLKTDEEGVPLADLDEVNPLAQESADDPYIWRRKWILSNSNINASASIIGQPNYQILRSLAERSYNSPPPATWQFGSVLDGPHIDAKTARVIRRQERLFGVIAGRGYDPTPGATALTDNVTNGYEYLHYSIDYRLLGSLAVRAGNRGNASR